MSEEPRITVALSLWDCERIVLGLTQMAKEVPGTGAFFTMNNLKNREIELAERIDKAARNMVEEARQP